MKRNSERRHTLIAATLIAALSAPAALAGPARSIEGLWGSAWGWVVSWWSKAGWDMDPWGEPNPAGGGTGTEGGTNVGLARDPDGKAGWDMDPDGTPSAPPEEGVNAGWCGDPNGGTCVPPGG